MIDFPTQLLQLSHRCSLSEVRGLVLQVMEEIPIGVIPEKSAIVMAKSHWFGALLGVLSHWQ